jgi:hypothetical protein
MIDGIRFNPSQYYIRPDVPGAVPSQPYSNSQIQASGVSSDPAVASRPGSGGVSAGKGVKDCKT